jgi:hypothetical protein
MIVVIRYDVDDERRRAFRHRLGKKGLATRKELQGEIISTLDCLFDDHLQGMVDAQRVEEENRGSTT